MSLWLLKHLTGESKRIWRLHLHKSRKHQKTLSAIPPPVPPPRSRKSCLAVSICLNKQQREEEIHSRIPTRYIDRRNEDFALFLIFSAVQDPHERWGCSFIPTASTHSNGQEAFVHPNNRRHIRENFQCQWAHYFLLQIITQT